MPENLLQLQNNFQEYLMQEKQDIKQSIMSTEKVSAEMRLAIYGEAYRSRLHEALEASYPALKKYLGEEEFEKLCYRYIDANPSVYRSIRWYGDQLAQFLKDPFLSELATLEWTLALVFDAKGGSVFQLQAMSALSPDSWADMKFIMHSSVYRLNFSWNTMQIWQKLMEEVSPPTLKKNARSEGWILWRQELTSRYASLPQDEAWGLDALLNGATFGELCEGLCEWVAEEEVALRAASLLKGWITAGLIVDVTIK